MGLLGWNTLTGYNTLNLEDDELPIIFSQNALYGLGLYFGDPSFDHSLTSIVYFDQLLNPAEEFGSQDPQLNIQIAYETAVLGPYLSLSGGILKRSINIDPNEFDEIIDEDSLDQSISSLGVPISSLLYVQAGLILPLSFEWNLSYLMNLQKYGFGFSNINFTVDIQSDILNQLSLNYSFVDPGRWTNQYSHQFSLSVGLLNTKGAVNTSNDEVVFAQEQFKILSGNWAIQKLWFNRVSTQFSFNPILFYNQAWFNQFNQQLNIKSQLIQAYSAIEMGSQYFTFRDLYLGFTTDLTYLDDYFAPQSNAFYQLNQRRNLLPTHQLLATPQGFNDFLFQSVYLETRVVPWGNYVSSWQVGARIDLENLNSRNTQYYISLSL